MESAIVETTNDTAVSDIQMEQWNAEINVGMAMLNCMEKYSMLAEYATCDVAEFFEEGAKLDAKIDSVDEWKNSGGKVKKIIGTIGSGILKALRAVANFFKNLFSKDKNPFARAKKLIEKMKLNSKKSLKEQLAEKDEHIKRYINRIINLKDEFNALKAKNIDLLKEVDKLNSALGDAKAENSRLTGVIQDLYEDLDIATRELDASQKENSELKSSLKQSNQTVGELEAELTKYEKEFADLSVKVDNAVNKVEAYFAKIDSGKISVDKRSASYKAIDSFKDMLLALQRKFKNV
jgi:chromosome segregation ATPase